MPDSLELTALLEIVIRIRFSVIVILNLTASFLQIHTDPLNFSAAARLIAPGNLYCITKMNKEGAFKRKHAIFVPTGTYVVCI